MLDRFRTYLRLQDDEGFGAARHQDEDVALAAAALMVEAALQDGVLDGEEEAKILSLLEKRFGIAPERSHALLNEARQSQHEASDLYRFTKALKDGLDADERIRLIEMLWEVAYADTMLDDYEDHLIRRIAGLLHVPDRDRGEARKRVLARRKAAEDREES